MTVSCAAQGRHVYALNTFQIPAGEGIGLEHIPVGSLIHHLSSSASCQRSYIHDIIGMLHHLLVMLHHYHGIAGIAEFT